MTLLGEHFQIGEVLVGDFTQSSGVGIDGGLEEDVELGLVEDEIVRVLVGSEAFSGGF